MSPGFGSQCSLYPSRDLFCWGQSFPDRPDWKQQFEKLQLERKKQNQEDTAKDSGDNRLRTLRLVAMISGEMDGAPIVGAGLVFGRDPDKVYVLTANHVVRRGTTEARNIQVRFKDAKDKPLASRLLPTFDATSDVVRRRRESSHWNALRHSNSSTVGPQYRQVRSGHITATICRLSPHSRGFKISQTHDPICFRAGSR